MFMTNNRWVSDSVSLPFVIKSKVVKKALQWGSEPRAQVQSYVSQTELTSELNLQSKYFILVERRFGSNNN